LSLIELTMEEVRKSTAGQGLGVAGFVIGIVALILSFIPCLGMYALVPGIIALIFSVIAFSKASSANAARGLIISALIISVLATSIASWQMMVFRRAATDIGDGFKESFHEDFGDEIREKIRRAIEDEEVIEESPDDTLRSDSEKMLKELERLEEEEIDTAPDSETDTVPKAETDTIPGEL
jgi:hypothetical protein